MQIVRAARDLDANTELTFQYQPTSAMRTYDETQKRLRNWGFECTCKLCLEKKFTPDKMMKKRQSLSLEYDAALRSIQLSRAESLLKQLGETYSARKGVPYPELGTQCLELGSALYLTEGNLTESIYFVLRGLEVLGYSIVACPPGNTSKEPVLEVTMWGHACEPVVLAFLHLSQVYKILAPELSIVARQYAEIAYTINYGEKESFNERCLDH